jgi:hypothetical protein
VKLTSRRARLLYASLFTAALLTAWGASATSRRVGPAAHFTHEEKDAPAAACVSPQRMAAWYPGDGNANDILGGVHGAMRNGATFAAGHVGQAFSLDGADDFVEVPHRAAHHPPAITVEGWFRVTSVSLAATLVSKSGGPVEGWKLTVTNDGLGRLRPIFTVGHTDPGTSASAVSNVTFAPNTFVHIAGSYDGSTVKVYLNGFWTGTASFPGFYTPSDIPVKIGASMKGLADEVSIYNLALSDAEVQAVHLAGAAGKCKDTIPFAVNNTNDGGVGSLRQAILNANGTAGTQTITFKIPGPGVRTIAPASALPTITAPVIIDGYTQPGASPNTLAVGNDASLLIELDGTNAGPLTDGLTISAGNSTVKGLVINRFKRSGIMLQTNGGNTVQGCFIGTGASGSGDLGNTHQGISVDSSGNTVGGTSPAARNILSGNDRSGLGFNLSTNNVAQGNYIGVNASGTAAVGNGQQGIEVSGGNNTIGGTAAGAGNVVSGNFNNGITFFSSGSGQTVQGNLIGTNATGTAAIPNNLGVLFTGTSNSTVGGAAAGARNIIAGNSGSLGGGIAVVGGSSGIVMRGNLIGTKADGTTALGNTGFGVRIEGGSSNNTLGGFTVAEQNRIAFNGGDGIELLGGTGNRINSNSIHGNTGLGIDLGGDGVTLNDPGDGDGGANRRQNFPVLTSVTLSGGGANVAGTLDSATNTVFTLQFFSNASCDPLSHGEGRTFLGSFDVNTDASGKVIFSAETLGPGLVSLEQFVTATATNKATNDTSEFSRCVQAAKPLQQTVKNTNDDGAGSLRQAINDIADGGTIDFASTPAARGTVTLSQPILISRPVTIVGPGANLLTLSGNNQRTILNVAAGAEVSISKLSFSNGSGGDGGAILNGGKLTLTDCTVSKSAAGGRGGALFNSAGGTLQLDRSTVSANTAGLGGGIFNAGTANVTASSVSGNGAQRGGGILNDGTGTLNLVNSTVSGNGAVAGGGGLGNEGGTLSITACTVYGNNTTQPGAGGGVSNGPGVSTLHSSIVANNVSGAERNDLFGTFNSQGFNLVGVLGAGAVLNPPQRDGARDQSGTLDKPLDPRLDRLRNYGGPTDTHALLQGSPALEAGDNALLSALSVDQRGAPRGFGQGVDVGAFENRGSVSGRVLLRDENILLTAVTLTLTGDSADGEHIVRDAVSGPAIVGGGNYTFMDVPAGSYTAEPEEDQFTFEPKRLDITVPATQIQDFFGVKLKCPTSEIRGRVTDAEGNGLAGVALTLSGRKTVVLTTPGAFQCEEGTDPGSFCFGNVTSAAGYTLTPTKDNVTLELEDVSPADSAFDNGRGGAEIPDLGDNCTGPGFVQGIDFKTSAAPPTPTPTPSDDFTADTTDPDRFRLGVLSLGADAFDEAVLVVQGNGQLQITPPAAKAPAPGGAQAAASEPERKFNGYVSVRGIDLNTSTSVSVKADQPIAGGGAHTVFSAGSDLNNFYRIRVGDPADAFDAAPPGSQARCTGAEVPGTPAIFFEAFLGGNKFQSAASDCAGFMQSTDVYLRLRLEPKTPASPAECDGVDADAYVLFETSVDRSTWDARYCAPARLSGTQVAAELLAGIVGTPTRHPGTAKFSDYRVADRTGIRFDPSNPDEVNQSLSTIELNLVRDGDLSSAATVALGVSGGPGVTPSTRRVTFNAGESTAGVTIPNPVAAGTQGNRAVTLKLADAIGGALAPGEDTAPLEIEDDFLTNRYGDPVVFTRQQYCDFLNRKPDGEGHVFWSGQFDHCNRDEACMERERIHVSSAFFLSIEFQRTGYFVYRLYQSSFARRPRFDDEFLPATRKVAGCVVVGRTGWEEQLERNRDAFFDEWVRSPEFKARFDPLNSGQFVDAIYLEGAGIKLTDDERTRLVLMLLTGQTTRAQVLRGLVESDAFVRGHFNRAFVLAQYFGYLRRDPDEEGFNFWLKKLNDFNGDFEAAEMVKAFTNSDEYKRRFQEVPSSSCEQAPTCSAP